MWRRAAVAACAMLCAPVSQALEPRTHWQLQCMGCHHPDGAGEPGRVPSLRDTLVPFAGIEEGRAFMIQVPGVAQSQLSDEEVAALLNWMVHNLSAQPLPESYRRFSAAEVTAARREPLAAVKARRAKMLTNLARASAIQQ
jgi:hypothetical protein